MADVVNATFKTSVGFARVNWFRLFAWHYPALNSNEKITQVESSLNRSTSSGMHANSSLSLLYVSGTTTAV
jgi:hypothetical protein